MTGTDWVVKKKSSKSSTLLANRININNDEAVHLCSQGRPSHQNKALQPLVNIIS